MTINELKNQFPAVPEYLTQIFLIDRAQEVVSNTRLAERLAVSRPAVTQAVGRLKKLNLVKQDRYEAIYLTPSGLTIATKIVKRHFLLEHLLVEILEYPWDKCDNEASQIQTSVSEEFIMYLDEWLGRPQVCPHGNPMPGSPVEKRVLAAPTLLEAKEGTNIRIIRITEAGELIVELLAFCQSNGVKPGKILRVEAHTQTGIICRDDSVQLEIPKDYAIHICWELQNE